MRTFEHSLVELDVKESVCVCVCEPACARSLKTYSICVIMTYLKFSTNSMCRICIVCAHGRACAHSRTHTNNLHQLDLISESHSFLLLLNVTECVGKFDVLCCALLLSRQDLHNLRCINSNNKTETMLNRSGKSVDKMLLLMVVVVMEKCGCRVHCLLNYLSNGFNLFCFEHCR